MIITSLCVEFFLALPLLAPSPPFLSPLGVWMVICVLREGSVYNYIDDFDIDAGTTIQGVKKHTTVITVISNGYMYSAVIFK